MSIRIFSQCTFFLVATTSFAQSDYAIGVKGDTIWGEIKILSYESIDRVQIGTKGKKVTFTALQIKSMRKDGQLYRPQSLENSVRLMKVLKDGYLSYYAFSSSSQNTWDGRYLRKMDGNGVEVPNLAFKKIMGKLMSDCGEIVLRIESGDLGRKDVEHIVDLYNACIQAKTDRLVTTKQNSSSSPNLDNAAAIASLRSKVEASEFLTKKDALDMLKDIQAKVLKGENVPNYLLEGLKSYLTDTPELETEFEKIIPLLKK